MVSLDSRPATAAEAESSGPAIEGKLTQLDSFVGRHVDPSADQIERMLKALGFSSLDALADAAVPAAIRLGRELQLPEACSERAALAELQAIADRNQVFRSFIGMGYHDCFTPPVIQRNILENPGWYTAYTPYQAEIAQGRMEALLNFQTMVIDLTGLDIANASLLDESTAAAEAMTLSCNVAKAQANAFFISQACHPQTIEVVRTRAESQGIEVIVGDHHSFDFERQPVFGALLQYPATDGTIYDYRGFIERAHASNALVTMAADPLSLALLTPPGELGADIAVGNTQRFGVPLGYGGPHAAYFATRAAYKRRIPGRMVGVSYDADGNPALRLALQTREQHIRRDRATSNICTAQVLLAAMASTYAVYHGPQGIARIARNVFNLTATLAAGLQRLGYRLETPCFFDTIRVSVTADSPQQSAAAILEAAEARGINLRSFDASSVSIALDETTTGDDLIALWQVFAASERLPFEPEALAGDAEVAWDAPLVRQSAYLTHSVFNSYHTETKLLRYLKRLEAKDLSLTTSMIPLGSCTMKLNGAAEMLPVTWPAFGKLHPFAPRSQARGYQILFEQLERWLAEITGFEAISLQPNAGSQGEYAGLKVIRKYHEQRGEGERNICLIPESAHGTNPASAVMAGMQVVAIDCDAQGNIDMADLRAKAQQYAERLAALMVTYPSTHGVFEDNIQQICDLIHEYGGQVYLDGANLNAQMGLCRPADYGADVCHLNLHKTFCIPHGGGGPGMGPIGAAPHLAPFLPGHPVIETGGELGIGAIAAAPWGSPSILPISWMFVRLMGARGLTQASQVAILNANYLAHRLEECFPILYKGNTGLVAHECIVDLRPIKQSAGITVGDVAKRLMDYGFHAPTVSWPVAGTMMVEPTESESQDELDRFCDAMAGIRDEIAAIERGEADPDNNALKHAPHTHQVLIAGDWQRPYAREHAAYPAPWLWEYKYWPPVARIDDAYGDRNLVCSCAGMEAYK